MSVPDNEIFNAIGTGGGVQSRDAEDDDDDDDDDDSGKKQRGDRHGVGRGDGGCTRYFTKAKLVVLRPFTKAKKQLLRKMNKRTSSSSRSAAENAGTSGKRFGCVGRGKGCYFCSTQPQTLESPTGSCASDPNSPNFTYDMLKAFIEKNDFYSKECNPHLDFDLTAGGME
ncbi:hypothetical protein I3760_02G000800 [Carya illinoinensis]|uniref:Uncharacterized protein n=1 Tax=Carya illinoinensis TaxID=32201 RepID=A0A922JXN4_CARIL|nr:hypothetical protein I3760_02G000800 [Carya illinoinensis]KAG6724823.1 hypothetical protein I3842_02G000900 [Carya illinoinensis]